jgi:endonuclease/exonuclease/phosphatase family metal-dependent hydrolase
MYKILKIFLIVLLIPAFILLFLIGYATITDYRPDPEQQLVNAGASAIPVSDSSVISLLIWNIGYCGLDEKMDFFYDGGKGVRTPEEQLMMNYASVNSFLQSQDSIDIFLFQEVDTRSKRSYRLNQVDRLSGEFDNYVGVFGKNYDVFFVPVPPARPMGAVNSGLLTLSRLVPSTAVRYSFPGEYGWPTRLFMLDRCFLVLRIPVSNGKELLVINTHNEAYDDGSIRDQQMAHLNEFLVEEYSLGNYILVGGDWNQCPPGFQPDFSGEVFDTLDIKNIEPGYLPAGWQWVYDNTIPTNRRLDIPYTKGKTRTTVIDFYLLSPNINMLDCNTIDLKFVNSDHQPVRLDIALQ